MADRAVTPVAVVLAVLLAGATLIAAASALAQGAGSGVAADPGPAADPGADRSCPLGQVLLQDQWLPLSVTGQGTGQGDRSIDFVGIESLRRWLRQATWELSPLPFAGLADPTAFERDDVVASVQVRGGWLVGVNLPAAGGGVAYYSRDGERYPVIETAGVSRIAAVGDGAVATITRYDSATGSGRAVFLHPDRSGRWQAGTALDLPGAPVFLATGRRQLVLLKHEETTTAAGQSRVVRVTRTFRVSAERGFEELPCR